MSELNEQNEIREKEQNKDGKQIAEKMAKEGAKKIASKSSLMGPLAHIIAIAAPILVLIIILGGIILFFLTMPGMVMEQLKGILRALGDYVAAFFGADTTKMIADTDIYKTLDYLEEMGYDLKGYGFLTDYVTNIDDIKNDKKEDYDDSNGAHLDDEMGVIRDDNEKIIYAKSDFMFAYIASDNYVYTLKNDNIATQEAANNWFTKTVTALATAWYRIRNAVFGPVFDLLQITNAVGETWGKGLIAIYYEKDPKNVGEKGTWLNQGSIWNLDNIKIDTSNKTLSIQRNTVFNNNNAIEFKLDGWSGRYGMPLEFLLSVHVATMMPDLAFDMIGNFPTTVNVYLHEVSGEATAGYKIGNNQYVDYATLQEALTGLKGKNPISALINWFDNWFTTSAEVEAARGLGIDVGTGTGKCTCEFFAGEYVSTDTYKIEKSGDDWIFSEDCTNDEGTVVHSKGDKYTGEAIEVTSVKNACQYCKDKLKAMTDNLANNNDYQFKAYTPYIANVKDHWYRDVYFVDKVDDDKNPPSGFIENDYEYEAVMKERWTLYETDKNTGEFILYKIDKDGNYLEKYDGTIDKAQAEDVAVAKKPVMIKADQTTYEDLGWKENGAGKWTAYDRTNTTSGYERLFDDEQIKEKIENLDDSKKEPYKDGLEKLYVNLNLTENVVQTGDGLRTATNPTIKKLFLQNKYFKYDGTAEKAEIITAFRKKLGKDDKNKYGALTADELKKELTVDEKTYKASDFASKVALNQDSLNAFNMLENTHTLDADYIYRDFKELIVELGYFKKEELTDETPRLLQWIVPDIGSGGYPERTIDKNENEFGTMIHSKGDISANTKNTILAMYMKAIETNEDDGVESGATIEDDKHGKKATLIENAPGINNNYTSSLAAANKETNSFSAVDNNIDIRNNVRGSGSNFERIPESGDGYDFKVRTGSVEYTHYYQFKGSYAEKTFKWSGATKTLHRAACGPTSCINLLTGYGQDVNPTKDIVGISFDATIGGCGKFMDEHGVSGKVIEAGNYKSAIEEAFSQGRPIITLMNNGNNNFWTSGGHFIAMVGQDSQGNIITLDSGSVKSERHTYTGGVDGLITTMKGLWVADEPPSGSARKSESYEGYLGNEAVVSPVTGILLDYGTYDGDSDKSSITDEKYRQNVDLKYIKPIDDDTKDPDADPNASKDEPKINPNYDPEKPDLVGYAKILVLDAENYKKLESLSENPWKKEGRTLVGISTKPDENGNDVSKVNYLDSDLDGWVLDKEERLTDRDGNKATDDPWTELAKTVYGYKEFGKSYEMAGISGYTVIIDGFKCEKPDENFTEDKLETESPKGDEITLDSFKKINLNNIESPNEKDVMLSLYEKDEAFKMASKKATEKAKAQATVKEQASSTLYLKDGSKELIFIKEGTLLGRTITDYELITDYRKEDYAKYRKTSSNKNNTDPDNTDPDKTKDKTKDEENQDSVIGNYLRILFKETDDTVVENVEDYMKLDEEGVKQQQGDHFSIVGTLLEKGEWAQLAVAYVQKKYSGATSSPFLSVSDMEKFYDICVDNGVNPEYAFATAAGESGFKSSNGNFWGLGTPNTSSSVATYGTWAVTLEAYCKTIVSYQDPTQWQYDAIMKNFEERSACTDNGGCDKNGYGKPDSIQGIQSLYSDLGKHGDAYSGSGKGGYYYMDPDIAKVTKIYATHAEFLAKCRNAGGVHAAGTNVTVWENAQYTAWQVEKKIAVAKDAFGEIAGTHDP